MTEKWKPVRGYEGLYEVSNLGSVRSLPRQAGKFRIKGRVLKQAKGRTGYLLVGLSKDGITKTVGVHRLVAEAFVENPEHKETVNHINEDKADNRANNLEWLTLRENIHYGTRAERARATITKNLGIPVLQIAADGHNALAEYDSISLAAEAVGAQATEILTCIKDRKKCRGYYWRKRDSITEADLLFWRDTGERVSVTKNDGLSRK